MQSDVGTKHYGFTYFMTIVAPKLKNGNLERLAWKDFQTNLPIIKKAILSENTEWKEYITIKN